jgi:predicted MPP superfamily phosphohydrolase
MFFDYLRRFAFYERGFQNASRIVLNRACIEASNLPESFESYKILHITDPHFDSLAGIEDAICELIDGIQFDLCLFTGDYTREMAGVFKHILSRMKKIVDTVDARDGVYATLGNHDSHRMVAPFEKMGITVLINETVSIYRGEEKISITGLDDPHLYLTDQAVDALRAAGDGFKIVSAHSPELYEKASECGFNLYLCGHTHGGQICLPSGTPVVTHLKCGRRFFRGLWKHAGMTGYTNSGAGIVSLPLRYNTQSGVALITLCRGNSTG